MERKEREFKLRLIHDQYCHLTGEMAGIECALGVLCGEEVASALLMRYMNRYRGRDDLSDKAAALGHGGTLDRGGDDGARIE